MPQVLNKHRHGIPVGAVYIGRPSKWGNPFGIGKDGTRAEVVRKYEAWLRNQPDLVEAAKRELRGKDVVCFCSPAACHGDVLVRVANAEQDGRTKQ
jgi:hypothetical protein